MSHLIACLDVWAPAVRDEVRRVAPPGFELRFADSYDAAHQQALAQEAEVLLAGIAAVPATLVAAASRLRVVHKWGVGVDSIDLGALRQRGIPLGITTGSNAGPVAELAIALMLAVYRRIPYVNRVMRQGAWPMAEMRESCWQIAGKTVGLLGLGHIGRKLAQRLQGFEAEVVYFDRQRAEPAVEQALRARFVPLAELRARSDILSLHVPLLPATARLVDAAFLAGMKPGAVLINTARGGLVDEAALYQALTRGHLRGAGLDAFDPEPPRAGNPLLGLEQVVLTPHAGGGVFDNVAHVARHAFGNIERLLRGESIAACDLVLAGGDRS